MKYVIVIPDGCSDEPQSDLAGMTPLAKAATPSMDWIAKTGIVGRANHVPERFEPGSAVANMSLFGFNPETYFTGRAPIEGIAQGIELGAGDWAIRCNLVTVTNGKLTSFTAGQIPSDEAGTLLEDFRSELEKHEAGNGVEVVSGVSYRNMLVCRKTETHVPPFDSSTQTVAPHDLTDQPIEPGHPQGSGSAWLLQMMDLSRQVFANHPINQRRMNNGSPPANQVWLWGLGQKPKLNDFRETFGVGPGAMITAVDLLRGLASLVGWKNIRVPGATGYLDTDYAAKGVYAIKALDDHDIVCVHVEATDEASHEGNTIEKIRALEEIDRHIVGPILKRLRQETDWRILVTPDHPTFLRTRTHSRGSVPFAICGKEVHADHFESYTETNANQSDIQYDQGYRLMPDFLNRQNDFKQGIEN